MRPRPCVGLALYALLALAGSRPALALEQHRAISPVEADNPLAELIPGETFLPPGIRAKGDDDFDNPAFPMVELGERLWSSASGTAGKSCQSCHGNGNANIDIMRVGAAYPKFLPEAKGVVTLGTRIDLCRERNMGAPKWGEDSIELMGMATYLKSLSRGTPSLASVRGGSASTFDKGRALFETKIGLLQLSCAQCHDKNYTQKFGSETLSQGHPLAYPAFKLSEGHVISLHERFRLCNKLVRAEPQPANSPDYVALELYLDWRSRNLPITAPGVRP